MLIREYRIPFPATVEEYNVGMQYMISRATKEEQKAGGENSVVFVKHERYVENEYQMPPGVYTEKVFYIRNFLPRFIKFFVPASKSTLVEKSWNAYPHHCLTVYESPWLGNAFTLSVESKYIANDRGRIPNALGLSQEDLETREVLVLDIASDEHLRMTDETDVRNFESKLTKRPSLGSDGIWVREHDPIMCCYKVCKLDVSTSLLPGRRVEHWGQRHGLQSSFIRYNRQVLRWIDSWFDLKLGDVERFAARELPTPITKQKPLANKRKAVATVATVVATELSTDAAAEFVFSCADATNPFSG